jgi:hypothetical protein
VARAYRDHAAGMTTRHAAAYLWAGPNTLIGLALAGVMLLFGAQARRVEGVVEASGGLLGDLFVSPHLGCPFRAVTLGHVILGTDAASLDCARSHEQVHVRQYERWGPAFLPAYLASSAWQLLRGRRCYLDNWFEREARDRAP